jgi:RHO1 GDP-GTP exchange protein 1/2
MLYRVLFINMRDSFKSVTIPQRDDQKYEKLAKRCESCRPMGMFRTSENEFLLCYDGELLTLILIQDVRELTFTVEFGLFVNRHGDPIRDKPLIEWEGTAECVAWHPPYVLIFDSRFIEVRTVETGRLCQIIQGEDVRMVWDGRGTSQPPPNFPREGQTWQDIFSLETRVHGVMRAPDPPPPSSNGLLTARRPVNAQHVFELVPTIPLYVPERLGSPTPQHATFGVYQGQMSNSPPQSPRMSTVSGGGGWR